MKCAYQDARGDVRECMRNCNQYEIQCWPQEQRKSGNRLLGEERVSPILGQCLKQGFIINLPQEIQL